MTNIAYNNITVPQEKYKHKIGNWYLHNGQLYLLTLDKNNCEKAFLLCIDGIPFDDNHMSCNMDYTITDSNFNNYTDNCCFVLVKYIEFNYQLG